MENESEQSFQCPYCGSSISMIVEAHAGGQEYIEDCEVCCRPIQISYSVEGYDIVNFFCRRLDD